MKEDVLEQIVDDYLMHQGYFTRHNLRFKPAKTHADFKGNQDSVASDIDVIGYHPHKQGHEKVLVVSCKSWQAGFDPAAKLKQIEQNKIASGREAWRGFRELCEPKWGEALQRAVEAATGQASFTYCTAVTRLVNPAGARLWQENIGFRQRIGGNPIRILELRTMLDELWQALTTTPAASDIGRAIQLIKASNWDPGHSAKDAARTAATLAVSED